MKDKTKEPKLKESKVKEPKIKKEGKKKQKPLIIVLIIALLGGLGTGGFFLWKHFNDKDKDGYRVVDPRKHVTITCSYGGSVNLESDNYKKGEKLELVATADEGYAFTGWVVEGGGEIDDAKASKTTYVVPEEYVTISATFCLEELKDATADQVAVFRAINNIEITYSEGDYYNSVTKDITLPDSFELSTLGAAFESVSGDEVAISWSSSDASVISNEGRVTRGDSDVQLTLTATASRGDVTEQKDFNLRVVSKAAYNREEIENITINDIVALNDGFSSFSLVYSDDGSRLKRVSGKYSEIPVKSVDTALSSIYSVRGLLGLYDPKDELKWIATNYDENTVSYTFQQMYDDIPVYGTTITVAADINTGETKSLNSSAISYYVLEDMYESFDELDDATINENYIKVKSIEKVIYSLGNYENNPVCAYKVTTEGKVVILNANNPECVELMSYSNVSAYGQYATTGQGLNEYGTLVQYPVSYIAGESEVYFLEDIERGIYVFGDQSGDTAHSYNANWNDATAISAYTNVITVYDWMVNNLGRNSINNNGLPLIVNVHDYKGEGLYSTAHFENATNEICFFDNENGTTPTSAASLDVVAHEMIHGMFNSMLYNRGAAEIPYAGEAGAIYEGYADVFANMITGVSSMSTSAAQNMVGFQNHGSYGTPQNINDESYYTGSDNDTYVHTNSTIVSNIYDLLAEYGLTEEELLSLWYSSMMLGFDAHSVFGDLRYNLEQAAINNGFSDELLALIRQAFDDEGIECKRGSLTINFAHVDGSEVTEAELAKITEVRLHRQLADYPQEDYVGLDTSFDSIYYGDYDINISFDGFEDFYGIARIEENLGTEVMVYLLKPGHGAVSGYITNATTGEYLEGVTLNVREGYNIREGNVIASLVTTEEGDYAFELESGYYTIEMSKEDFVTGYFNVAIDDGKFLEDINASISSNMELGSSYRVVLTWGENPHDLDSHLECSARDYSYHVYYGDKNGYMGDEHVCNLDVDDTSSYGPETTTFIIDAYANYDFYIDWFAGSGTWAESGARVEVYNGSMLAYVYNVPYVNDSYGDWHVFSINNGIYRSVNEIR